MFVQGSSNSVGSAPVTTPAPSSETKNMKYSYSYCGIAWYENQNQYTGEECCKECQDDTHTPYTLDKISWKNGDCYCIDTSRSNCGSDEFESDGGWTSKDCTQGRRKREADVQRSEDTELQREAEESVMKSEDTELQREVNERVKRSVDTLTQREITCSSVYQSGQSLYWKYQYQIPHSCWSKSLVLVKFTDPTYLSS